MRPIARTLVIAVVLAVFATTSPGAAAKRSITETDLYKFTWIADPQISPDGATVAFVQVTVNEKDNKYEHAVYTVPATGAAPPRRLTGGTRDISPRWSPTASGSRSCGPTTRTHLRSSSCRPAVEKRDR